MSASGRPVLLLVDVGNTRLKWAVAERDSLSCHGSARLGDDPRAAVAAAVRAAPGADRIVVGNVAGDVVSGAFADAVRGGRSAAVEYAVVVPMAAGVTIAYERPERLGVDRWLALIAAHAEIDGAALVVDAGTALTIDALDATGRHLGGMIAPGVETMRYSLVGRTAKIRDTGTTGTDSVPPLFASDTGAAVTAGAVHSNAALIGRAWHGLARRVAAEPALLLTGGGARTLAPALEPTYECLDDLVLRGLAIAARHGLTVSERE